jgi:hypothetical protein
MTPRHGRFRQGVNSSDLGYPEYSRRLCFTPEAHNSLCAPDSPSRNQGFTALINVELIAQLAVGSSILESLSALEQVILAGWGGAFFRMKDE